MSVSQGHIAPNASHTLAPSERATLHWMLWGLVVPLIFYAARTVEVLTRVEIPFDSLHTYLPLARQLLEDAAQLFSDPKMLKVAPGAVVYMALSGADPVAVKAANLAISLVALVLTFDAARRIGGRVAAAAAAWLFVLPHMLVEAGAVLMGEAPFVFLVAVWLWATTYAVDTTAGTRAARWRIGAVVLAGLALAAATLTRGTYMYWLPFAVVAFFAASRKLQGAQRGAAVRIAAVHLIALALVGAYMARQNEEFGRPIVATGTGAALYFGSNPVLSGYEPPYFGLVHDESTITDGQGHLSIEGDRRLMAVAKTMLRETPFPVLAQMYVQKLGAVLFFSRAHLDRHVMNDRSWRVVLVILACLGAWGGRRHLMVWMVTGAAAYQCAVHVPVLYNPRYSISALDILFVLLAAQGVAMLWRQPRRGMALGGALATIVAGVALGAYHLRNSAPLMPDLSLGHPVLLQMAEPGTVQTQGWEGDPFAAEVPMASGKALVEWRAKVFKMDGISILRLPLERLEGQCQRLWVGYTRPDGAARASLVRLDGLKAGQDITWGTMPLLMPGPPGRLTMEFHCKPGTRMQFGEPGLYEASEGRFYREKALSPP
ncbi:hypothetical protein AVHY2522_20405 [Acidovorax sp. SUPP2522]|uniref:hypothetical protein n=1 Tax=unclassified Acidovorax TaxID=2684926 RepID=UPI00234B7619|nr:MULTISPECIES: hypothetical protein [unclassified Acidovorax]WCM96916.1 hypothetical protein M5C96_21270 [Acidovorax sp. GBBC 1281]GKT18863.1 hypothetical protein AVHY2522_20405 [Acidovorax sp. SUPP2522]